VLEVSTIEGRRLTGSCCCCSSKISTCPALSISMSADLIGAKLFLVVTGLCDTVRDVFSSCVEGGQGTPTPEQYPCEHSVHQETERDGHLPFLDIYSKPYGSLGHNVYRKPTHTNLYLNPNFHHHPSNIQAVLSTLVHRARSLCDQESLHGELDFLRTILRKSGYSDRQTRRALNPPLRVASTPEKPDSVAFVPYVGTTSQPHQQAAIQAHHHICVPNPEEDPRFPLTCEGWLGTQDSWCVQRALSV
jgi:hypothetical protein